MLQATIEERDDFKNRLEDLENQTLQSGGFTEQMAQAQAEIEKRDQTIGELTSLLASSEDRCKALQDEVEEKMIKIFPRICFFAQISSEIDLK